MKYAFEEFLPSPPQEPELPATEAERLHKEIADLQVQVETYRRETTCDDWFQKHIERLCDDAAKTSTMRVRELIKTELAAGGVKIAREQISSVVDEVLHEAFPEMRRAILSYVQPHALKR